MENKTYCKKTKKILLNALNIKETDFLRRERVWFLSGIDFNRLFKKINMVCLINNNLFVFIF